MDGGNGIVGGGAGGAVGQAPPESKPKVRYWTKRWKFDEMAASDLSRRLGAIGIDVPVSLDGQVSVDLLVAVPLNRLRDAKAYRLDGTISSPRLTIDQLRLSDMKAELSYRDGTLQLTRLDSGWVDTRQPTAPPGRVRGEAQVQLSPLGEASGSVTLSDLSIEPLQRWLLAEPEDVEVKESPQADQRRRFAGTANGRLKFRLPVRSVSDVATWDVETRLVLAPFRFGNADAISVDTGTVVLRNGLLRAPHLRVASQRFPDARIDASCAIQVGAPRRLTFRVLANDLSLQAIAESSFKASPVKGKVDLSFSGTGDYGQGKFSASGRIASPSLTLLNVDLGLLEHRFEFDEQQFALTPIAPHLSGSANSSPVRVRSLQATYSVTPTAWSLHQLKAQMLEGTVAGTASLSREEKGTHQVQLAWKGLEPTVRPPGRTLLPLSMRSDGSLRWSAPAGDLAAATGRLDLTVDELASGGAMFGSLELQATSGNRLMTAKGNGNLFDGLAEVEFSGPGDFWNLLKPSRNSGASGNNAPNRPAENWTGRVSLRSARLEEMVRLLSHQGMRRLSGDASATVNFSSDEDSDFPQADIQLAVSDVRHGGKPLTPRFNARLQSRGESLRFQNVQAEVAGGHVQASGNWAWGRGDRRIETAVTDVDVERLLSPWFPKLATQLSGKVTGNASLVGGNQWRLTGTVSARASHAYRIPLGHWSSGLYASFTPDLRRWQLSLPSIQGQLARGRLRGEVRLSSSLARRYAPDLESRWYVDRVDFGEVIADVSDSIAAVAHGRVTGDLIVNGSGIKSVKDLTGRFDAKLKDTQARAVPGLTAADQFLGVLSLTRTRFQDGEARGVIGGGAAHLQEFYLRANQAQVWAQGRVPLGPGGVDLEVVVSTGSYALNNRSQIAPRVAALAMQLAIQSILPVTALVEINRLVANRTLHLAFSGPLNDPRVRLKPIETIREEAARFLIRELLVATSLSSNSWDAF